MKSDIKDIRDMSEEELTIMLTDIRSRRKQGYTIRKKATSTRKEEPVLESLAGLSDEMAMKILDELLADDT